MCNKRILFFTLMLLTITSYVYAKSKKKAELSGVSDTRFGKLRRGINLDGWFIYERKKDKQHYETYVTSEDIKLLKSIGLTHVRLNIKPTLLYDESNPSVINKENLGYVDAALDKLLAQDMAVIIDMHGLDSKRLINDTPNFARFWEVLAEHLSVRDPEMVFLEVLNEPGVEVGSLWIDIQKKILAAMRRGAPNHTLIATVHDWSSIDNLLILRPVSDPDVIYNFHFYEPFEFTHQGATWGPKIWAYFDKVPYPATPELVKKILPSIENDEAKQVLIFYGQRRWNAKKIDKRIAQAAKWAKKRKVRVICDEFGVCKWRANPVDRNSWIKDVRSVFEKYDIGWAMWDYATSFSLFEKENGKRKLDVDTARALGLMVDK